MIVMFLFGLLVALYSWGLYKFGFNHGYEQAIDDMKKVPIKRS